MFLLHPDVFFWDFLIVIFLSLGLAMTILAFAYLRMHPNAGKLTGIFVGIFGTIGFLGFCLTLYGSFIEPKLIVATRTTLTHPMATPMRIAVISDLHVGPYKDKKFVKAVVDAINGVLPDIVLMPGDFIFGESADIDGLEPLKNLRAPLGVFAVLGNHDMGQYETPFGERYSGKNRGEAVAKALIENNVEVLRNDHAVIPTTEGTTVIAGIDDLWTGNGDVKKALTGIPEGAFVILVSHNPSVIKETESAAAELTVSGHTHGGQLRLPGIGALPHIPTTIGQEFDQGLFPLPGNRFLAITRGVGESNARARLFAWPEILVIDVTSDK